LLPKRILRVVLGSNGRVRPDVVLVKGRPERRSEGSYYLAWREKAGASACRSARMPKLPPVVSGKRLNSVAE